MPVQIDFCRTCTAAVYDVEGVPGACGCPEGQLKQLLAASRAPRRPAPQTIRQAAGLPPAPQGGLRVNNPLATPSQQPVRQPLPQQRVAAPQQRPVVQQQRPMQQQRVAAAPVQRPAARGQFEIDMDFWGNSTSIDSDIAQMLSTGPTNSRTASSSDAVDIESLQGLWNTEGAEALLDPSYRAGSGDLDSIWAEQAAEERETLAAMSRTASTSNEISFDNDMDSELATYSEPPRRDYRAARPQPRSPIEGPRVQVGQAGRFAVVAEAPEVPITPRPVNTVQSFRQQVLDREAKGLPAPVERRPSALERAAEYASKPSAWSRLMDDDEG